MRLTEAEIQALREALDGLPIERVFLFGSRTDDARRGGDIDVLLYSRARRPPLCLPTRHPAASPAHWTQSWTCWWSILIPPPRSSRPSCVRCDSFRSMTPSEIASLLEASRRRYEAAAELLAASLARYRLFDPARTYTP
jgi:hypothetical protein